MSGSNLHSPACVPDGLVEEGSSVVLVDGDCDPSDPDDVGGVLISAGTGRACYNGTTEGSTAKYFCNCENSYSMMPETTITRVCDSSGNWSEPTVPQCQPRCKLVIYCINTASFFFTNWAHILYMPRIAMYLLHVFVCSLEPSCPNFFRLQ